MLVDLDKHVIATISKHAQKASTFHCPSRSRNDTLAVEREGLHLSHCGSAGLDSSFAIQVPIGQFVEVSSCNSAGQCQASSAEGQACRVGLLWSHSCAHCED